MQKSEENKMEERLNNDVGIEVISDSNEKKQGNLSRKDGTVYYRPLSKPATLLVFKRGEDIRPIKLEGHMKMGREMERSLCELQIKSSIVSGEHGVFNFNHSENSYYYKDKNSTNGTFLNKKKLGTKSVKLNNGDILRIDRQTLDKPHEEAVMIIFSTSFEITDVWKRYDIAPNNNISIGRSAECEISLDDFMVSRNHAELIRNKDGWEIVDKDSKNGISINNKTIDGKKQLEVFDVIRIANTTLIFTEEYIMYNEISSSDRMDKANSTIMSIDINNVTVENGKKTLLKDVKLEIEYGDYILIMGAAGAGKSTFIKTLTKEIDAEAKLNFEGLDLYKNYKMLKHKIGVVKQFSTTRDSDTVYHTIMDAAQIKLAGEYSADEINQRVEDVIERMKLSEIRDSLISVISGGQKKRVEVAIQAIGDQVVYILDEPDSGIDYAGRKDLKENLKACTETGGVVLIISHTPDDTMRLFTKVIVLAKSKKDGIGHLAYYGDVSSALSFFGVNNLSEITLKIDKECGSENADKYIDKFRMLREEI